MAGNNGLPAAINIVALNELRRAGHTWEEISNRLGVSTSGLRRWRQDNTDEVGLITHHLT
jgi:transposase-like protein